MLAALSKDYSVMQATTHRSSIRRVQPCSTTQEPWRACLCHYHSCVGWYPCGLKYCKGKDSSGKVVSYRCGIKTCSKCRMFEYHVAHKHQCIWDEQDWGLRYVGQAQNAALGWEDEVPAQAEDEAGDVAQLAPDEMDSEPLKDKPGVDERAQPRVVNQAVVVEGQEEGGDDDILR